MFLIKRMSLAMPLDEGALSMSSLSWSIETNTRGGTRAHNLLLRREAPYPLGHTGGCTKEDVFVWSSIMMLFVSGLASCRDVGYTTSMPEDLVDLKIL